jgi:hypothetical protein
MKLFQNRFVAILLAVLVVISSTLINTNIKFGRKCKEVSNQFYGASVSRGAPEVSIAEALEVICTEAESLSVVADSCGADASDVRNDVSNLRRSIQQEYFYGIRSSYAALRSALTTLLGQLAQADLDEQNTKTVTQCTASLSDAQTAIAASGYNDTVRSFLRRYDHFPTNLLASLSGVDMPETFS